MLRVSFSLFPHAFSYIASPLYHISETYQGRITTSNPIHFKTFNIILASKTITFFWSFIWID